ncbi:MAG: outer membrane lipoprotein-sorting protein [Gammaproteobacteria bacterium]|nr:outer membrane lipoprotein-sorting protein [Gammaproteobacteria bacterium]
MHKIISRSLFVFVMVANLSYGQTGLDVMKEQDRRHRSDQEFTEYTMTLLDSRGKEKQRRMVSYSKNIEHGQSKSLIKFLEPTNISNVGLLTWSDSEQESDNQWLYLPASKKIKRITGGGKASSFMSTDFAFEDMRPENLDTHTYTIIREEEIEGQLCWVIEALPSTSKEKRDSGYSKRQLWVGHDHYLTIKTDFYDRRKKLSKKGV